MELSCGLQSQIFGDDQIISQVSGRWIRQGSRRRWTPLWRLCSAPRDRGQKGKDQGAPHQCGPVCGGRHDRPSEKEQIGIREKKCMVIGNGEIGRLAAAELVKAGGDVSMTLRQYKTREAVIPAGCQVIPYDSRYERLSKWRSS